MPRKEKPEGDKPAASPSLAAANKYARWRTSVEELLNDKWHGSADVANVAATVVGMFDAGATDAEVAAFLRAQELSDDTERGLTDEARLTLVQELHRSAALA